MNKSGQRYDKPQFVDSINLMFVLFLAMVIGFATADIIAHGIIGVESNCADKPPGQTGTECMHVLFVTLSAICFLLYSFLGVAIMEYVKEKVVK